MFSLQVNIETQNQVIVQILTSEYISKTCSYFTFKSANLEMQSNFPL